MYYHVLAAFGDTDRDRVLFSNLDKEQLHSQFVSAYNSGKPIIAGIYSLNPESLRSVRVIETEGQSTPSESTPAYPGIDWSPIAGAGRWAAGPSTVLEQAGWILSNGKEVTSKYVERNLTWLHALGSAITQLLLLGAFNAFLGWLFFDDLARLINRALGID
jgi:hypothetical protein